MQAAFALQSLILLVAVTMTACVTVGPGYTPPELNVPAEWNRLDTSVDPATHAAAVDDLSRWWHGFGDPLLSELVEEALQAGPDLRSARAGLREARARRGVAAAEGFPSVTASGAASRGQSSEKTGGGSTRELYSAGFDAGWELDVFGGVRRGIEAAEADLESSQASLRAVRVSLAAEVALNYVETRALGIRLGIARDNLASQSETLRLTEWRVQAGLASSQDAEQARGNMEQTRAQIPVLAANLAEAEHRLDILLGKPPGTLHPRLAEAGALPALPDQVAVGIPADTLRQRPDVLAAERALAAQTARVGEAEAARYPSFRLSGSIGLEALTWGGLGNTGASTWSLLAGITAPVFDAGRLRAQVEIQDAKREQALVEYEKTVLSALQDVENALVAIVRNQERREALSSAADAVRTAALLARHRYGAGLIDFQSVLDTERTVLSVEDGLASTQADGVLALIRLYKALGGGWSPQAGAPSSGKENS
ncbi:efflux transporter outer membrane subunit [Desulfonatronum sp. SC1]|uniref:efflux transporter outer membrane subunit n=1 Tax=Desulfonatronum sp. SC1 TaxID=2109626 RepID=UPI000D31C3EE|nr:efflux transporter outer membrane subunit [Desulfonatronum sp. SC1]PTN34487.1 RND transporter [Desulfonatronum sp. SC1]